MLNSRIWNELLAETSTIKEQLPSDLPEKLVDTIKEQLIKWAEFEQNFKLWLGLELDYFLMNAAWEEKNLARFS